ncbi:MAG: HdeD family acid-resistance protein [Mycobacterium sp.]|nr:HdeD family acid-resistance protein [Mycobacterium sp.]
MTTHSANATTHSANAKQLFQRLWTVEIVFGVLNVILGVVMLVYPGPSIIVAAVLFGVFLALSGVAEFIAAVSLPVASAAARVLLLVSAAASIILAVLAFRHFEEGYGVLLLAIWIGIGFVFRGVSAAAAAISDHAFPGRGWAIFFGIVSVIAGIVVLAYPFDSISVLILVAGVWLIIIGVLEIVSGISLRSDARKFEKSFEHAAAA